MSDVAIIMLLTLAVYYPVTLGVMACLMFMAYRRRGSPQWRLALVLLSVMFVLIALAAFNWYRYR
nr:hypothetical protein [Serratia fonticola]